MSIPLRTGDSFESFFEGDEDLIICIGCGCDDLHGCIGDDGEACHWLRVDDDEQLGVCSECPEHVARFDAGDRTLGPDAAPAPTPQTDESLLLPGDPEYGQTLSYLRDRTPPR